MKIDGIWKVELQGAYGMRRVSTAMLRKGRYFGGSADHYTIGSFKVDGSAFSAKVCANQHGEVQALFGTRKRKLKLRVEAIVNKKGDKITGISRLPKGKKFSIKIRLTRLADLD